MINLFTNKIYTINCISRNSKPDVNLSVFDSKTLKPISNLTNSVLRKNCSSSKLCTNILEIYLNINNLQYENIKSLSCLAQSRDPRVRLGEAINRTINIIDISNQSNKYFYFRLPVLFRYN